MRRDAAVRGFSRGINRAPRHLAVNSRRLLRIWARHNSRPRLDDGLTRPSQLFYVRDVLAQARPTGVTTSGTKEGNRAGEAVALTVFSTVRRWGLAELPLFFLLLRTSGKSLGTLKRLSFIHSARWALVREIPYNGEPQPRVTLRHS